MKILVTGARGFTGRHFVDQAARAGHDCLELVANITDLNSLNAALAALPIADAVVHFAGISFAGHRRAEDFYAVNTIGTQNFLEALVRAGYGGKRVVIASTAAVYGSGHATAITESDPIAPTSHYGASKATMELLAKGFSNQLDLILTRPFNYTGPGQSADFIVPKLINAFRNRHPEISLGNLQVEREFNDVRDTCATYLTLLSRTVEASVYNLCSGDGYSVQSIVDRLVRLTGHSPRILIDPKFVRANDPPRLTGSAEKLRLAVGEAARLAPRDLDDTLAWRLDESAA